MPHRGARALGGGVVAFPQRSLTFKLSLPARPRFHTDRHSDYDYQCNCKQELNVPILNQMFLNDDNSIVDFLSKLSPMTHDSWPKRIKKTTLWCPFEGSIFGPFFHLVKWPEISNFAQQHSCLMVGVQLWPSNIFQHS